MAFFDDLFPGLDSEFKEGTDYYLSKEGYRIMTESYLVKRGYCCGNGCRHCPYDPTARKGNRQLRPGLEAKYRGAE
jgi:hypothetical protein